MSATLLQKPTLNPATPGTAAAQAKTRQEVADRARRLVTRLNLHFAAVGLLALLCVYLMVQMGFAWQAKRSRNADALAQQRVTMHSAEAAAKPLQGLDTKLAQATADADDFYQRRLPVSDSQVATELGDLTKKQSVKLTRAQYLHAPVLAGTAGEMTELRIDASLSGDYRPLVQFINALERDKMFFVINGVALSGQQSGTVSLRLRLTAYEQGRVAPDLPEENATPSTASAAPPSTTGGPGQ